MSDLARLYRELDLEPGASTDEVKVAYRDLVQIWHPDRFGDNERLRLKAEETLKRINDAYERLKRLDPDEALHNGRGGEPIYQPETHERRSPDRLELEILKEGVRAWNLWRNKYSDIRPSLAGANLRRRRLESIDFREMDLTDATLDHADLYKANLSAADLRRARLKAAQLHRALAIETDFRQTELSGADLSSADLRGSVFAGAHMADTQLIGARLDGADLAAADGLLQWQFEHTSWDAATRLPPGIRHV